MRSMTKWLLGILVLLIIVFVGLFIYTHQSVKFAPEPPDKIPADLDLTNKSALNSNNVSDMSTVGWKTYENKNYGFSFNYPNTWQIEENNFAGSNNILDITDSNKIDSMKEELEINYYDSVSQFTQDATIKTFDQAMNKLSGYGKVGNIKIGNLDAQEFAEKLGGKIILLLIKDEHIFSFSFEDNALTQTEQSFLPTFKFDIAKSPVTYTTYKDPLYPLEISYPSTFNFDDCGGAGCTPGNDLGWERVTKTSGDLNIQMTRIPTSKQALDLVLFSPQTNLSVQTTNLLDNLKKQALIKGFTSIDSNELSFLNTTVLGLSNSNMFGKPDEFGKTNQNYTENWFFVKDQVLYQINFISGSYNQGSIDQQKSGLIDFKNIVKTLKFTK